MLGAAQAAGAGNIPGEVERFIKELTEPKMNWRDLLRQQIQSTIKNDYSWQRPSRKGWHTGAVLPGMTFDTTIDICIGIDMSGSIGNDQANTFLSEVQGIMQEYQDYRIKLCVLIQRYITSKILLLTMVLNYQNTKLWVAVEQTLWRIGDIWKKKVLIQNVS